MSAGLKRVCYQIPVLKYSSYSTSLHLPDFYRLPISSYRRYRCRCYNSHCPHRHHHHHHRQQHPDHHQQDRQDHNHRMITDYPLSYSSTIFYHDDGIRQTSGCLCPACRLSAELPSLLGRRMGLTADCTSAHSRADNPSHASHVDTAEARVVAEKLVRVVAGTFRVMTTRSKVLDLLMPLIPACEYPAERPQCAHAKSGNGGVIHPQGDPYTTSVAWRILGITFAAIKTFCCLARICSYHVYVLSVFVSVSAVPLVERICGAAHINRNQQLGAKAVSVVSGQCAVVAAPSMVKDFLEDFCRN